MYWKPCTVISVLEDVAGSIYFACINRLYRLGLIWFGPIKFSINCVVYMYALSLSLHLLFAISSMPASLVLFGQNCFFSLLISSIPDYTCYISYSYFDSRISMMFSLNSFTNLNYFLLLLVSASDCMLMF